MPVHDEAVFRCPQCGQRIIVDSDVQDHLIGEGCIVCDAAVSQSDFVLLK